MVKKMTTRTNMIDQQNPKFFNTNSRKLKVNSSIVVRNTLVPVVKDVD